MHRSATRLPRASPVFSMTSIRNCESSRGDYTPRETILGIQVGVGACHKSAFEGFSYWSSSGLMPHIGVVKTSATGLLYPQSVTPERVRSPRMARATRSACRYGTRRHSTSNKQCNACRRRKDRDAE